MKAIFLFLVSLLLSLGTHAATPFEVLRDKGRAIPFYKDSEDPEQQRFIDLAKNAHLAENMAGFVNNTLLLRSDIGVGIEACHQVNAMFIRQRRSIVICSELLAMMPKAAADDTEVMPQLSKEQMAQVFNGAILGIFLHELAHALIYVNSVPITGREEDVADQFAVWFAVNFVDLNRFPVVMPTIWFFSRMAKMHDLPSMTEQQRQAFMSNEHSLDEQRIYNLACWVMGTGSAGGAKTARFARLPSERAQRCQVEYSQVDAGMKNLFKRFFKVMPLRGAW